jgi:Flp pilus assembly protein TadB
VESTDANSGCGEYSLGSSEIARGSALVSSKGSNMDDQCDVTSSRQYRPWRRRFSGFVFLTLLVAAIAFWVTGHRAHIMVAVPYLILLACPLMHLFHHRKHRSRHKYNPSDAGRL